MLLSTRWLVSQHPVSSVMVLLYIQPVLHRSLQCLVVREVQKKIEIGTASADLYSLSYRK